MTPRPLPDEPCTFDCRECAERGECLRDWDDKPAEPPHDAWLAAQGVDPDTGECSF